MEVALIFLGGCLVLAAFIVVSVRIYQVNSDFMAKILKYMFLIGFAAGLSFLSVILGILIGNRHSQFEQSHMRSVQDIWGGLITQAPPDFSLQTKQINEYVNQKTGLKEKRLETVFKPQSFNRQDLQFEVKKNIREKGLLKFPGYVVQFNGFFVVENKTGQTGDFRFNFTLPTLAKKLSGMKVKSNGKVYKGDTNLADGFMWSGKMTPGEKRTFRVVYQGQGTKRFTFSASNVEINKFTAALTTDYKDFQLPDGSMVPTGESAGENDVELKWEATDLVGRQNIALDLKIEANYGERVSRMFLFAPIGIFLFLGCLIVFSTAKQMELHPMNFVFLGIGYFIFHLLVAYLVSYGILLGIFAALVVSSAIVIYYGYLLRPKVNIISTLFLALALFQWVFAMAFFIPDHTSFIITLASIAAFVFLMRVTAKVDWADKW